MRVLLLAAAIASLTACGSKPEPMPPKRPNTELIVGDFERHPPNGTQVLSFTAGGTFELFHDRAAQSKHEVAASGHYKLDGDVLSWTNDQGLCADSDATKSATYKVVISKIGIHFTKQGDDACDRRASIDNQTWYRFK